MWPFNGSGSWQLNASATAYYNGFGIGMTQTINQYSGASPINPSDATTKVAFFAPLTHTPYMDLWWVDYEGSYYSWNSGGLATAHSDISSYYANAHSAWISNAIPTTLYLGCYPANPCGLRELAAGYGAEWGNSPAAVKSARDDNDAISTTLGNDWDWYGPEIYITGNCTISAFAVEASRLANEYTRKGLTKPLIPFIKAVTATTQEEITSQLEILIRMPEMSGVVLWGADTVTAPDYYDSKDWMIATKAFTEKYAIEHGAPV